MIEIVEMDFQQYHDFQLMRIMRMVETLSSTADLEKVHRVATRLSEMACSLAVAARQEMKQTTQSVDQE